MNYMNNKVVLTGRAGVGKSSLAVRWAHGVFNELQETTIGAAYYHKVIKLPSGSIKLQVWDTAGQDRYRSLVPMYLRGSNVILLCFDKPDLRDLKNRIREIILVNDTAKIMLIATKHDEEEFCLGPGYDDLEAYAKTVELDVYYTSAHTGRNVNKVFRDAAVFCQDRQNTKNDELENSIVDFYSSTEKPKSLNCCYQFS